MSLPLKQISKVYNVGAEDVYALNDVSLTINENEYAAIMGPSGSGKSTLMNILGCLDTPTSGAYNLAGRDVAKLNDDQLAEIRNQNIGFVFQTFNLLPRSTLLQTVDLPLIYMGYGVRERRQMAEQALEQVGLSDRIRHKPSEISGGQRQRVAIARAIVSDPKLLLCDEPTGDLDRNTADEILEMLQLLNKEFGKTIVMVTHDPSAAKYATHTLHLDKGQFVEKDLVA